MVPHHYHCLFVSIIAVLDILFALFMITWPVHDSLAICWERIASLVFAVMLDGVLGVSVPFTFDVLGGMCTLILSVPDHCPFIYFVGWCGIRK